MTRGGQVALVLADLWMPDMTGIELLTKAHALEPAAKRALLTGWGDMRVVTVWSGRPSLARSTTGA
jgi:YesN/AraC family two-component response regulator